MSASGRTHWQHIYSDKDSTTFSWYESIPEISMQLIRSTGVEQSAPILDAGGGDSTLVDHLLDEGYTDISVLDMSGKALERARARLGDAADAVIWIESDVIEFTPSRRYTLWHDRALFHFLTEAADREKYVNVVCSALRPGGHLVLATFGTQGPERCSGLEIRRYGVRQLQDILGTRFKLRGHEFADHETPMGSTQQFLYSWWQALS